MNFNEWSSGDIIEWILDHTDNGDLTYEQLEGWGSHRDLVDVAEGMLDSL